MKKVFSVLTLILALFVLTACNSNTPDGVAEKGMKCMQQKDYAGFVDLVYFGKDKHPTAEDKKNLEELIRTKAGEAYEKKEGIKSYEVVSEEMSEDGSKAAVKMKIVYNNGTEDDDKISLIKDQEGQWRIDIGK